MSCYPCSSKKYIRIKFMVWLSGFKEILQYDLSVVVSSVRHATQCYSIDANVAVALVVVFVAVVVTIENWCWRGSVFDTSGYLARNEALKSGWGEKECWKAKKKKKNRQGIRERYSSNVQTLLLLSFCLNCKLENCNCGLSTVTLGFRTNNLH